MRIVVQLCNCKCNDEADKINSYFSIHLEDRKWRLHLLKIRKYLFLILIV